MSISRRNRSAYSTERVISLLAEIVRSGPILRRALPRYMHERIATLTESAAFLEGYLSFREGIFPVRSQVAKPNRERKRR